jgi:hypothetical protein
MEFASTYSVHSGHFGRVLSHFLRRFLHNRHDRVANWGGRLPEEDVISGDILELTTRRGARVGANTVAFPVYAGRPPHFIDRTLM